MESGDVGFWGRLEGSGVHSLVYSPINQLISILKKISERASQVSQVNGVW